MATAKMILVSPAGFGRDELGAALERAGHKVKAVNPGTDDGDWAGFDAIVYLPGEDPLAAGPVVGEEVSRLAKLAASAGARIVYCSTSLLYDDLGETENAANDPELAVSAGLEQLADAELTLFGSGAEFLLLRLGVLLDQLSPAASELSEGLLGGRLLIPDDGQRFVALLDRATLAEALGQVAASNLHGGWDLVAATAPLDGLLDEAASCLGLARAQRASVATAFDRAGERVALRWLASRRVTGAALREAGAAQPCSWQAIVRASLL